jgi:hypothetical protein
LITCIAWAKPGPAALLAELSMVLAGLESMNNVGADEVLFRVLRHKGSYKNTVAMTPFV